MQKWGSFKELMDHEIRWLNLQLTTQGYKLDGNNGIKIAIQFNNQKSVDYIADNPQLKLIEFSDLFRQQNEIPKKITAIHNSDSLDKKTKIELIKHENQKIKKELVDKYKDTINIIHEMLRQHPCLDLEAIYGTNHDMTTKYYHIIIAPFHENIEAQKQDELNRFINNLADQVTQCLPKQWNVRVHINILPSA